MKQRTNQSDLARAVRIGVASGAAILLCTACGGMPGSSSGDSSAGTMVFNVYTEAGSQLMVLNDGDDGPREITSATDDLFYGFDISPDGVVVYGVEEDGHYRIYTLRADDSSPRKIVDLDFLGSREAEFCVDSNISMAPSGGGVTFASTDSDDGWGSGCAPTELWVVNIDGTGLRKLLDYDDERSSSDLSNPRLSPDGGRIAFLRSNPPGIFVINRDGTGLQRLVNTKDANYGFLDTLVWSPDGSKMGLVDQDSKEMFVVNADGTGGVNKVLETPEMEEGFDYLHTPAFSPDGSMIAYRRAAMTNPMETLTDPANALESSKSEIYIMNVDGSNIRQLTDSGHEIDAAGDPIFTSDGNSIVFPGGPVSATASPDDFGIYVINVDGTGIDKIASGRSDSVRVGDR